MYDRVVDVPRLMGSLPEGGPAPEVVADVQVVLRQRYGMEFDRIGLALYRDGRQVWAFDFPEAVVEVVSDTEIVYTSAQPLGPLHGLTVVAAFPHGLVSFPGPLARLARFVAANSARGTTSNSRWSSGAGPDTRPPSRCSS